MVTIRALVVDDSALMRKLVSDILSKDQLITIIGTAYNGKDAVEKTQKLKPDVITMDVEMPIMNGIDAVKEIMSTNPTPIIMLSALTTQGADTTFDALDAGAVDYLCKPSGSISTDIATIGTELIEKVKTAALAHVKTRKSTILSKDSIASKTIKILLVDDSAFVRKTLLDIISREPDLKIIAEAENGSDALQKLQNIKPDIILMDIEMPEMNGVQATFQIMKTHPVPIIIFSGKTTEGMKDIKLALELGAVDFIPKPSDQAAIRSMGPLLMKKIRECSSQKCTTLSSQKKPAETENILLIGTSTGGPQTLAELVPQIPGNIPAGILIVQHMPPVFTKSLADRLNRSSSITVSEALEGDEIHIGHALVAPGDYHMTVYEKNVNGKQKRYVSLNKEDRIHGVRPAVDITFSSAVKVFGANTIGVILTGMGRDGAQSMGLIKAKGGYTIAQDEKTSIIFGMPDAAIKLGVIDIVLPLNQISSHITKIMTTLQKKVVS